MPKMQIVTDAMLDRARLIGQASDLMFSNQNAVTQIFQNMGHDFSGRVPGLMTQHMIAMESDYKSMNTILTNYRTFMEDAARNYEWTEDELARWAESLGNGEQSGTSGTSVNTGDTGTSTPANDGGTTPTPPVTETPPQGPEQPEPTDQYGQEGTDTSSRNPSNYNYDASGYQGYSEYRWNCYKFVDKVLKDEGRGAIGGLYTGGATLSGMTPIDGGQFITGQTSSSAPTADEIRSIFSNAQVGDVVQMKWNSWSNPSAHESSPHTAIISKIDENGVQFMHSNVSNGSIKNSDYSWADLARYYTNAGNGGGASIYRFS